MRRKLGAPPANQYFFYQTPSGVTGTSRAWVVCRVVLRGHIVRREHFGGASTNYTPSLRWEPIWYTDYARINAHGTAARRAGGDA